jgi:hypothetical protein
MYYKHYIISKLYCNIIIRSIAVGLEIGIEIEIEIEIEKKL